MLWLRKTHNNKYMTILRTLAFTILYLLLTIPQSFADEVVDERAKEQEELKFFAQYDRWLPAQLIDKRPDDSGPGRPPSNLPDDTEFSCIATLKGNARIFSFYYLTYFQNQTDLCPFPELMTQLAKGGYSTYMSGIPRYSIIPFFGRFHLLDCPNGKKTEKRWDVTAFRLKREEEPKGITLNRKSIVFLYTTPEQDKKGFSECRNHFYDYSIYIEYIKLNTQTKILIASRINEKYREDIYKVGDILEFSKFGHKIINIVAPQELKDPIRGHKCFLVGYVELDPTPIPLTNPHLDEIIPPEYPAPPESELTAEEKKDIPVPHPVDGKEKASDIVEPEETESGIGLLSGTILCVVIVVIIGGIVLFLRKA
jgi:hypothetical protein